MATPTHPALIYKLADPRDWGAAMAEGVYRGSAADRADGFIHFSTGPQLPGTLEKHYADAHRLALVEVEAASLGPALKWEAARGGELFPHLYGDLPLTAVATLRLIARDESGAWRLPSEILE